MYRISLINTTYFDFWEISVATVTIIIVDKNDLCINENCLNSSKNKVWKKIQVRKGFDPMTSAIPMQRFTNWVKITRERWRFYIHFFITVLIIFIYPQS